MTQLLTFVVVLLSVCNTVEHMSVIEGKKVLLSHTYCVLSVLNHFAIHHKNKSVRDSSRAYLWHLHTHTRSERLNVCEISLEPLECTVLG